MDVSVDYLLDLGLTLRPFITKEETVQAIEETERKKETAPESSGTVAIGRGDAIRTRNQWFWRPLLYR